jgi:sigma-E factor negative regulatory protein RseC
MNKNTVTHPGIVSKIDGNNLDISIIVRSGCASCEIKGACSVSDVEKKSVIVTVNNPNNYKINQSVTVVMKQSLGTWAVLLGYVFPFIVVLLSLIITLNIGLDEGISGLISIFILVPYYLGIYASRNYLSSKFKYSIRT